MAAHLEFEQWVPFPLEPVFRFFANPRNLPRIMPPSTGTRIDDLRLVAPPPPANETNFAELAGVGTQIDTSFRVLPPLPFRATWVAVITEFEWNHHFADIQTKGPFKKWHHRHEFSEELRSGMPGTIVRDVIEYEAGFGVAGKLAEKLFISAQMPRMFAHRQQILGSLLEKTQKE